MEAIKLECVDRTNPVGIDITQPTFSWQLSAEGYGKIQSAYHVRCSMEPDNWEQQALLWNSGKIASSRQINIRYLGRPLESRQRVYWQVKVWDESGVEGPWSEQAYFELGILDQHLWKARWIDPQPESVDRETQYPATILKKDFVLSQVPGKARMYITSHGIYRLKINTRLVSKALFTPGYTNYTSRLQLQTWDVTNLLVKGTNRIEVELGDGWYRGRVGILGKRNVYGDRLALLAQLEIFFNEGTMETIVTDGTWLASQDGPNRMNDFKDGEVYEAGREPKEWHEVQIRNYGYKMLVGTNAPPVLEKETFNPEVIVTPDGNTVLDFGQNLVGYISFSVTGPGGHRVKLTHGEVLDEHGNFTMKNLYLALKGAVQVRQEIQYILKGGERESFKPSFSFSGFRYVLLENWPETVSAENFRAIAVYSDLEETTLFSCSNPNINQLVSNALWSQKGNFLDIPTDCPQRERAGWTGDIQAYCRTGSFLMDTRAFLKKWLLDLKSQQHENGMVSNIVPSVGMDGDSGLLFRMLEGSAGWGDAAVIVPWTLWKMYGDTDVLEQQWESMKAWVDYQAAQAKKTHWSRLLKPNPYRKYTWDTKYHWGEWLEPDKTINQQIPGIIKRLFFSEPEVATAYFAYSSALLAEIASTIGKEQEAEKYEELSSNAKNAYRYNFIGKNGISSDRQCRFVRPVALDLIEADSRQSTIDKLAEHIIENGYRIGTGFLSTPLICKTLSDFGYTDIAYKMVLQESIPGWMYPILKGATTIWETWDAINDNNEPSASHNHYAYGAVVSWFVDTITGIDIDLRDPKTADFVLTPKPGGDLNHARCTYQSVKGPITSAWILEGQQIVFSFKIPANSTARLVLPIQKTHGLTVQKGALKTEDFLQNQQGVLECEIGSGDYDLQCPAKLLNI